MDDNKKYVLDAKVERTIKALAKNRMAAVYAPTKEAAVQAVKDLLQEGDTISCGGSVTLTESGVRDLMKSGAYRFLDREEEDPQEVHHDPAGPGGRGAHPHFRHDAGEDRGLLLF